MLPSSPPFTHADAQNLATVASTQPSPIAITTLPITTLPITTLPATPSPPVISEVKPTDSDLGTLVPGGAVIKFGSTMADYLKKELGVEKITGIYRHLWWAGRRGNIRPLHRQLMMQRNIRITECPSLHLVWYDSTIYIKPMPEYLLNWEFFNEHICPNDELSQSACGFLFSYSKLIRHKSDLNVAIEAGLLPSRITWAAWCSFVPNIQKIPEEQINKRYVYGELRLRRLNQIYNFCRWSLVYHSPYTQYDHYFTQNFAWLLLLFAYLTIVLTAMQVVLATPDATVPFKDISYWFGLGSILVVLVGAFMILGLFVSLFTYNLIITLFFQTQKERLGIVIEEQVTPGSQYRNH